MARLPPANRGKLSTGYRLQATGYRSHIPKPAYVPRPLVVVFAEPEKNKFRIPFHYPAAPADQGRRERRENSMVS